MSILSSFRQAPESIFERLGIYGEGIEVDEPTAIRAQRMISTHLVPLVR